MSPSCRPMCHTHQPIAAQNIISCHRKEKISQIRAICMPISDYKRQTCFEQPFLLVHDIRIILQHGNCTGARLQQASTRRTKELADRDDGTCIPAAVDPARPLSRICLCLLSRPPSPPGVTWSRDRSRAIKVLLAGNGIHEHVSLVKRGNQVERADLRTGDCLVRRQFAAGDACMLLDPRTLIPCFR